MNVRLARARRTVTLAVMFAFVSTLVMCVLFASRLRQEALALAVDRGVVRTGHKAALLGIGSGINSLMLAVEW